MNEVKAPLKCAKCGKSLSKVLPVGHEASKSFLRKNNYDGVEWSEFYDTMKQFDLPYLPEPFIANPGTRYAHQWGTILFMSRLYSERVQIHG